jgi:hypothetical protein
MLLYNVLTKLGIEKPTSFTLLSVKVDRCCNTQQHIV